MPRDNRNRGKFGYFFFSILTAALTGVALSFIGIEGGRILTRKTFYTNASGKIASIIESNKFISDDSKENDEEDPTFISFFSRGFIYAANSKTSIDNLPGSIIESLKSIPDQTISAQSYSVVNLDKNIKILEKDSDRLMPIASVTKIVTAVVAMKLMGGDRTILVTQNALDTEGNTGRLRLNEKYKLKEIFYPLLMVSSNDAAEAIAEAYGREKFIREMNSWVNSIGAYRTYFHDPSGLSPSNLSTANDIYIISKWIRDHEPEIFDITLTKNKTIRTHTWVNPTHFLNLAEYAGGKNGYTPEAQLTSVSLFSVGLPKNLYAVVLLGSKQRDIDTLSVLNEALK